MLAAIVSMSVYPLCMAFCMKNIRIMNIKGREIFLYYCFFCVTSFLFQHAIKIKYLLFYIFVFVLISQIIIHRLFQKAIMITVLTCIIFVISDTLASILFLFVFKKNIYSTKGNIIAVQLVFFSALVYLFSWVIGRVLENLKESITNRKVVYFMSFHLVMVFSIIYLNHVTTTYMGTKTKPGYVVISGLLYTVYFITSIILFIIILRYLTEEKKFKTEKMLMDANKKYIQEMEESYSNLRRIKHDYNNIITSLKIFVDEENMEGLKKYFYNEFTNLNVSLLNQDQILSQLYNIKISEIKSVLLYKSYFAYECSLQLSIEVRDEICGVAISTAILIQILGILMDNAIEAAVETKDKELKIAVFRNESSSIFIIQNSFIPTEYSNSQFFQMGFSTKGMGRGIGLATVREYMNRYSNLYLETEKTNSYFTQIMTIQDLQLRGRGKLA